MSPSTASPSQVASLHLHPEEPGAALTQVQAIQVIEGQGIQADARYFGRVSGSTGQVTRRQVSLIEREQIAEHAAALGLDGIAPGLVRANIEATGIDLVPLVGKEIEIGEAVVFVFAPRDPCAKMDAICQGLRERMVPHKQGVMAEVRRSGRICLGDTIRVKP
jgi:MOSC domain-containing protein YiiM